MQIKTATTKDVDTLHKFKKELLNHELKLDPNLILRYASSKEHIENSIEHKDHTYFIAFEGKKPIGYLHVAIDDEKNKQLSYLSELFVLEEYRSKGVGRALVDHQIEFLKGQRVIRNTLTTARENNERTINFYKKLGYEITKEHKSKNLVYISKLI